MTTFDIYAERKSAKDHKAAPKKKLAEMTEKELAAMTREEFLALLKPSLRKNIRSAWAESDKDHKRSR